MCIILCFELHGELCGCIVVFMGGSYEEIDLSIAFFFIYNKYYDLYQDNLIKEISK